MFVNFLIMIISVLNVYENELTNRLYEAQTHKTTIYNKRSNEIIIWLFYITSANVLKQVFYTYLRSKLYVSLMTKFFKKICLQTCEIWDKYYDKTELTKIILNDNRVFITVVSDIIEIILKGIVNTVLISYFLLKNDWKYFVFSGVMCGCRSFLLEKLAVYWEKKMDVVQSTRLNIEKYMTEFINNNMQIQMYGIQSIYLKCIDELYKLYDTQKNNEIKWYFIFISCFFIVTRLLDIGIFFILDFENTHSLSDIYTIIVYFKMISDTIQSVTDINKILIRNKDNLLRVIEYNTKHNSFGIKNKTEKKYKREFREELENDLKIEFRNIMFKYPTRDLVIFNNFSYVFKKGMKYIISGKSGNGKSTLIKLLLKLYSVNKGDILINGTNIENIDIKSIHTLFSIIPQEPIILEDKTLKENVTLFVNRDLEDVEIIAVLKKVELGSILSEYDKKTVNLSGGQKQRLAIARAILSDTPVIILDEAFSALDKHLKKQLYKLMYTYCKKKMVLMITHDSRFLFRGAKVIRI